MSRVGAVIALVVSLGFSSGCGPRDRERVIIDQRFDLPAETEIPFSKTVLIREGTRRLSVDLRLRAGSDVTLAVLRKPDFMGERNERPVVVEQSGPSRSPSLSLELAPGAYEVLVSPDNPRPAHNFSLRIAVGPRIR